jgi:hypothetical protein
MGGWDNAKDMAIRIQRYYRKRLAKRYYFGRRLVRRKEMEKRMVVENQERYNAIAAKEGRMIQEEVEY